MKKTADKKDSAALRAGAVLFWVAVWWAASEIAGRELLIPSPRSVAVRLCGLLCDRDFYAAAAGSLCNISAGFLCAALVGSAGAALAARFRAVRYLAGPIMGVIRATPVAAFVILALILVGSEHLAALMGFLMVMPVFYTEILSGIDGVPREQFEAAEVFGMISSDRFRFIYMPFVVERFRSACSVGMGMAWKSGVAAEVIGIAARSLGGALYDAKLCLDTAEVFAITTVVIALSVALEKIALLLVSAAEAIILADRR